MPAGGLAWGRPVMDQETGMQLRDIRKAILGGEFFLEYLPTVVLANGRCAGAEALIRWRHDGQIIPPMQFIPSIEGTPLIGMLTYWVIEAVGRELGAWLARQTDSVHIGINVPPELLGRGGLEYAGLKSELRALSHKLVLEVSERGLIDHLGVQYLNDRAGHDVLIALDDVQLREIGSLLLARVKVDIIKLDKTAVESITADPPAKELETVRALASLPDLAIIAEGVERQTQADQLRELGVGYAQGFLFSRPISAQRFMAFFHERNPR
jgi:sensor c-di-GMP phosphodiesterase-like protein